MVKTGSAPLQWGAILVLGGLGLLPSLPRQSWHGAEDGTSQPYPDPDPFRRAGPVQLQGQPPRAQCLRWT